MTQMLQNFRSGPRLEFILNQIPEGSEGTLRFHFVELQFDAEKSRVFTIQVGDSDYVNNLDIVGASGGKGKHIFKDFRISNTSSSGVKVLLTSSTGTSNKASISFKLTALGELNCSPVH